MEEPFGLQHLFFTEDNTRLVTENYLAGIAEHYPNIIDVFFKLQYFVGEFDSNYKEYENFQVFCFESYVQAPYTFWAIYDLYRKGYYLEATILIRHSLELFVQLKYFNKYPEKMKEHLVGRYISFKTMFLEFTSEGFYKTYYGKLLSSFAHGKLAKNIYRFKRSDSGRTSVMGCEFNPEHASYIMNNSISLLFGFLNHFKIFFPNNNLDKCMGEYKRLMKIMDWIEQYMDGLKKVNPKSIEWYKDIDKLIYSQ